MPFWAVVMGVIGALATLLFYKGMLTAQAFFTGKSETVNTIANNFNILQCLILPTFGGLVAGLLLMISKRYQTTAKNDYMEAVTLGDGRLSFRQGILRVLSSLSTITTGGSIGREGPVIHLGAMLASGVGRIFSADVVHLRILVACGAAAGVSAAYNAPIAAVMFVVEIVIGSTNMSLLVLLLLSSCTAHLIMRYVGEYTLMYETSGVFPIGSTEIIWAIVIGLMSGVGGPGFLRLLSFSRKRINKLALSLPLRMAAGGLLVGIFLCFDRDLAGNGSHVIQSYLNDDWGWKLLLVFLILKILATALTVGPGAVGGVITPVMLMGASFALLFTLITEYFFPQMVPQQSAFVLVGMGAFLAAAASAPMMTIVMVIEMANNLSLAPMLIIACSISYMVSRRINGMVMYGVTENRASSETLRRELRKLQAEDFVRQPRNVIFKHSSLREAILKFTQYSVRYVYVVNEVGQYLGVVAHKDITRLMLDDIDLDQPLPESLISNEYLAPLHTGMTLDELQHSLTNFSGERLPVIDQSDPPYLIGVINKSEVLTKYGEIKESLDHTSEVLMDLKS